MAIDKSPITDFKKARKFESNFCQL